MPVASGGFELRAGASVNVTVPDGWIGSWTPRTGCAFDAEGLGSCEVGDCGGVLACDLDAGLMPQNVTTVSEAAPVHVLSRRGGAPSASCRSRRQSSASIPGAAWTTTT